MNLQELKSKIETLEFIISADPPTLADKIRLETQLKDLTEQYNALLADSSKQIVIENDKRKNENDARVEEKEQTRNALEKLKNDFLKSLPYSILKKFQSDDKNIQDILKKINYPAIANENNDDVIEMYKAAIKTATNKAISLISEINTIGSINIPNIVHEIIPNTEPIKQRCKIILEELKITFESPQKRRELSDIELFNLYSGYIQLANYTNANTLSDEMLDELESQLKPIYNRLWEKALTRPENFQQGNEFGFLVHCTTSSQKIEDFKRGKSVSCSYITDKQMGTYPTRVGYILGASGTNDIKRVSSKDMGTYELNGKQEFGNSNSTLLMAPSSLEQKCIEQNRKHSNGKALVNEEHNEILKADFDPQGIFCIDFGEKEMSLNYNMAKQLSEQTQLPLINIDILDYRMKRSKQYSDAELITEKEKDLLVKGIINFYFKKHSPSILEQPMQMEEIYIKMRESLTKMFLEYKKSCFIQNIPFSITSFESTLDGIFQPNLKISKVESNHNQLASGEQVEKVVEPTENISDGESGTYAEGFHEDVNSAEGSITIVGTTADAQMFELVNLIVNKEIPELLWDQDGNIITEEQLKTFSGPVKTDYENQTARLDRRAELNSLSLEELLGYSNQLFKIPVSISK